MLNYKKKIIFLNLNETQRQIINLILLLRVDFLKNKKKKINIFKNNNIKNVSISFLVLSQKLRTLLRFLIKRRSNSCFTKKKWISF